MYLLIKQFNDILNIVKDIILLAVLTAFIRYGW